MRTIASVKSATPWKRRSTAVWMWFSAVTTMPSPCATSCRPSEQAASVTITNETTSFRLEGEPTAFVQYLENYTTSHEHNVTHVPYRDIRRGALLDMPLTFSWPDGTYAAITEASLRHYAGHVADAAFGRGSSR